MLVHSFTLSPSCASLTGGYADLATLWQRPYLLIFTFKFQKTPLGCGVAVAEGIKAFAENGCSDFDPQPSDFQLMIEWSKKKDKKKAPQQCGANLILK